MEEGNIENIVDLELRHLVYLNLFCVILDKSLNLSNALVMWSFIHQEQKLY